MADTCPTCGTYVRFITSEEGTGYCVPADPHRERLTDVLGKVWRLAEELRDGGYKPEGVPLIAAQMCRDIETALQPLPDESERGSE